MINRYLTDLISLLFPKTCAGCDTPLVYGENLICTACWHHLPFIPPSDRIRPLQTGLSASFLYLIDSSRVQRMIHQLKYHNHPEIGHLLGQQYGKILQDMLPFRAADVLIPIPLHPRKLRKRGYNQSTFIAQGLSCALQMPLAEKGLIRTRITTSQTQKNRYERYENMESAFQLGDGAAILEKHILLVDDVLTTGATLEACAAVLLAGGARKVDAITIARTL